MANRSCIFLCGPITGQSPDGITEWRKYARNKLAAAEISVLDPTRNVTDASVGSEKSLSDKARLARMLHGHSTVQRDRFDVERCDLVLANFLGCSGERARVSIGSVGELFWADAFRKPVVLVREESHNVHDHAMLNDLAGWIFSDLDVALAAVERILI